MNKLQLNTEQFRQIKTILLRTISTFQNMFDFKWVIRQLRSISNHI